jgi:hypothetical protein
MIRPLLGCVCIGLNFVPGRRSALSADPVRGPITAAPTQFADSQLDFSLGRSAISSTPILIFAFTAITIGC